MRTVRIETLVEYVEIIAGHAVHYRGAKDPVEDMKPSVVRSWQRNRRIREDQGRGQQVSLAEHEERLVEGFQRQALPFLQAVPGCHLNWLAVARHHHPPTRLLDWTRNPLIAPYFAASHRGPPPPGGGVGRRLRLRLEGRRRAGRPAPHAAARRGPGHAPRGRGPDRGGGLIAVGA